MSPPIIDWNGFLSQMAALREKARTSPIRHDETIPCECGETLVEALDGGLLCPWCDCQKPWEDER